MADGKQGLAGSAGADGATSDAALISSWLSETDERAFADIVSRVGASEAGALDRLDAALLSLTATNRSLDDRLRLIKFYAVFKIAEMQRYREFRGFPR